MRRKNRVSAKDLKKRFSKPDKMKSIVHDLYREISFHLAIPFLAIGATANQITVFSVLFGLVGAYYYSIGAYLLATLFIAIFSILDHVDGLVARHNNNMGKYRGEFLEIFSHAFLNLAIDIGLVIGVYRSTGTMIMLGLVMIALRMLIKFESYSNYKALLMTQTSLHYNPDTVVDLTGIRKFIYYALFTSVCVNYTILFFAMLGLLPLYIVLQVCARAFKLLYALRFHWCKK